MQEAHVKYPSEMQVTAQVGKKNKMRNEVKLQGRMLRSQSPVDHGLNEANVLERMFSQHMSG